MDDPGITVDSKQARDALRQVARQVDPAAARALTDVAGRVVAQVRAAVPRKSGRATASVRKSGAGLEFGGAVAPYFPWLDFGGKVGRKQLVTRPYESKGRYVFPAIRQHRADMEREAERALGKVIQRAGLD